jgi:hypothetical protein
LANSNACLFSLTFGAKEVSAFVFGLTALSADKAMEGTAGVEAGETGANELTIEQKRQNETAFTT